MFLRPNYLEKGVKIIIILQYKYQFNNIFPCPSLDKSSYAVLRVLKVCRNQIFFLSEEWARLFNNFFLLERTLEDEHLRIFLNYIISCPLGKAMNEVGSYGERQGWLKWLETVICQKRSPELRILLTPFQLNFLGKSSIIISTWTSSKNLNLVFC